MCAAQLLHAAQPVTIDRNRRSRSPEYAAEFVKRPKIGAEGERTRRLEKTELGASEEERLLEALLRVRAKKMQKKHQIWL
jgi:hypothetical protein